MMSQTGPGIGDEPVHTYFHISFKTFPHCCLYHYLVSLGPSDAYMRR